MARNWLEALQAQMGPAAGLLAQQPNPGSQVGRPQVGPGAMIDDSPGLPPGSDQNALMAAMQAYLKRSGHKVDPLMRPGERKYTGFRDQPRPAADFVGQVVAQSGPRRGRTAFQYKLPDGRTANVYYTKDGRRSIKVFGGGR